MRIRGQLADGSGEWVLETEAAARSADFSVLSAPDLSVTPRYLSIKQAARYCNAAVWAIRRLLWAGHVPHVRLGRRFVIDRASLDAWMAGSA